MDGWKTEKQVRREVKEEKRRDEMRWDEQSREEKSRAEKSREEQVRESVKKCERGKRKLMQVREQVAKSQYTVCVFSNALQLRRVEK